MSRITASALTAFAALAVVGSIFALAHAGHKAPAAPVAVVMPAAASPAGDTTVPDALTALEAAATVSDSMPATF